MMFRRVRAWTGVGGGGGIGTALSGRGVVILKDRRRVVNVEI